MWPPLVKNVIDACVQYRARFVFFDNVYAIGGDNVNHITEASPISPASKKGEVRAEVNKLILNSIESQTLDAIIARSPDFFGSVINKSMLMTMVYNNLRKNKKAQWVCNAKAIHSMGYTPDLGKGTALLGNTPAAYNQIWNLPTDPAKNQYQVLSKWGIQTLGLFIPILKELSEMCYQYDRDYYFDSTKFNRHFNYVPAINREAVKQTLAAVEIKF